MQIFQIYAVAADNLLVLIIILQSLFILRDWLQKQFVLFVLQIFIYLFFLNRYLILSLSTKFSILIYTLYWAATVFCIIYKTSTALKISIRIDNLFLINIISLYAAVYLSILADALEISLSNLRYIYNSVELITGAFATAHVDLSATIGKKNSIDLLFQIFGLTISLLLYII